MIRLRKYIFIILLCFMILSQISYSAKAISPPSWIRGEWKCQFELITITFRFNDIIIGEEFITMSLKDSFPSANIEEKKSESKYEVSFNVHGVINSFRFIRVSPEKINYYTTAMGFTAGPQVLYLQERKAEELGESKEEKKVAKFGGGSGTRMDPYIIKTAQHLDDVRNYLDSHFIQTADIYLFNYTTAWDPIGEYSIKNYNGDNKAFSGSYNGQNHKITGLNLGSSAVYSGGLFALVGESGELKNINLVDSGISVSERGGALAGINNGKIINCHAIGGGIGGVFYLGGLVGVNKGKISRSSSSVSISGDTELGGLVGLNFGDVFESFSYNNIIEGRSKNIGGLVGQDIDGKISDSYADSKLIGDINIGGLVGSNNSNSIIKNSYSISTLEGSDKIGGIVGDKFPYMNIINSYYEINKLDEIYSEGGYPKEASEMKQRLTFEEWDFDNTWQIIENLSYPFLQASDKIVTDRWEINPRNAEPGQQVNLSYTIKNSSKTKIQRILYPVLIRPDGNNEEGLISKIVTLEPNSEKTITWEFYPMMKGYWDFMFVVWDHEVMENIMYELFKGERIVVNLIRIIMSDAIEKQDGPYDSLLMVGGEEYVLLRNYLERSRELIFDDMVKPSRETWVEKFIGRFSHADQAYKNAIDLHNLAKDNWNQAKNKLNNNEHEAALKFMNMAMDNNYLAYAILNNSTDMFIESAERGMETTKTIMKVNYEIGKVIALLKFGPEGYKAVARLNTAGDFIFQGFTEGWDESSKELAAKVITNKLIDESEILKHLQVEGMITDEEIYNRLIKTLDSQEFAEKLIWELTVSDLTNELVSHGTEEMIDKVIEEALIQTQKTLINLY